MYCKNCGSEIADSAKFCSNCGTPVESPARSISVADIASQQPDGEADTQTKPSSAHLFMSSPAAESSAIPKKSVFEEFQWNIDDYPDRFTVEKTEDVDFNWNADPNDIPEPIRRPASRESKPALDVDEPAEPVKTESFPESLKEADLHNSIFGQSEQPMDPESMSAADRIDKFYTFNKKNEEFQQLLNKEYQRVKSGNAIEHELSQAEQNADEMFQARPVDSSMEAFLEREGIVKPYQPKAFESDVLQKIEAQEAEKEAKRLEEEARLKAIEDARIEAENKKKAEEEAARLEEIARKKAEEEAKAAEEARRKAAEKARIRAEEEAKRKAEEEARLKAEAEAKVKAAEEARIKAEADLRAAQEAAKIRAQQEARIAAEAEAKFKADQERKQLEIAEAQRILEAKRRRLAEEANQAVAEEEARRVLEQTARMRKEEEAKIKAVVADLREGSLTASQSGVRKEVEEAHQATKNQINEMARARDAYFAELAELEEKEAKEKEALQQTQQTADDKSGKPAQTAETPQKMPAEDDRKPLVTGRNTMLSSGNDLTKTRVVDKAAILAGLEDATPTIVSSKTESAPAAEEDDDFFSSLDKASTSAAPASAADQADLAASHDELTGAAPDHEPQPIDFREEPENFSDVDDLLSQFESVNHMLEPADEPVQESDIFSHVSHDYDQNESFYAEPEEAVYHSTADHAGQGGHAGYSDHAGHAAATNYGLNDTVIMSHSSRIDNAPANDFDSYGNAEAAEYINRQAHMQEQQQGYHQDTRAYGAEFKDSSVGDIYSDDIYGAEEAPLSKKEQKQIAKDKKRIEKERAKEAKAARKKADDGFGDYDDSYDMEEMEESGSGGKGKVVLKVILVILIIILAVEVIGMGIRFLAPNSGAAQFIDNQLNKVIHLITGDEDTDYTVMSSQDGQQNAQDSQISEDDIGAEAGGDAVMLDPETVE